MHPSLPGARPETLLPPCDAASLHRMLQARFAQRAPLQAALLEALFGHANPAGLLPAEGRRLQALLAARSDAELERLARSGFAGRCSVRFELEVALEGEPDGQERAAMARSLLALLRHHAWQAPTVVVRAVLLQMLDPPAAPAQATRASRRCSPSGS